MEKFRTEQQERFNSEIVEKAKQAHGITEECHSWADWYAMGYLVRREEKAHPLFKVRIYPRYPDREELYLAPHFAKSQVYPHPCMVQQS